MWKPTLDHEEQSPSAFEFLKRGDPRNLEIFRLADPHLSFSFETMMSQSTSGTQLWFNLRRKSWNFTCPCHCPCPCHTTRTKHISEGEHGQVPAPSSEQPVPVHHWAMRLCSRAIAIHRTNPHSSGVRQPRSRVSLWSAKSKWRIYYAFYYKNIRILYQSILYHIFIIFRSISFHPDFETKQWCKRCLRT